MPQHIHCARFVRQGATTTFAVLTLLALCFTLMTSPAQAQTSFGKMRSAAPKTSPPEIDEEEEDAPKTQGNSAPNAKPSTGAKPTNNSIANRSRRTTSGRPAAASANRADAASNAEPNGDDATDDDQDAIEYVEQSPDDAQDPSDATEEEKNEAEPDSTPEETSKPTSTRAPSSASGKRGPLLGQAVTHKYRAGMQFAARPGGTCTNVIGTAPVPMEFPEQKVRTLQEDFPRIARVDYRDLKEGGARQLVFHMRELKEGQSVEASVLFEVTRYQILPPTDTSLYHIPKTVPNDVKRYLRSGTYIESGSKTVRTLARNLVKDIESDWDKVDAFFNYIRENIQYKDLLIEKPMRGALAALKTNDGDCEDMSALFIALCRASDVPARLVRVPGHCWAEFYLVDDQKNGYWFPAQVAGTEPLGSMQDTRVILQKGDAFKLPESPKEETLYVKELFMGRVKENGPDPIHQFIQETDGK
ncbi:MAG: transglutaminase-like domain-containing protein [Planctomycetia bacterium]|nr:transglutaminase-like domain-containing protein [Planctomycetia bacterium]